ncbi:MAG: hypothetical protein LBR79_00980 [Oscillospiraceae bacterium]|nr:hypothetical protein [Oscillospiraceae bacterium]
MDHHQKNFKTITFLFFSMLWVGGKILLTNLDHHQKFSKIIIFLSFPPL